MKKFCYICGQNEGIKSSYKELGVYKEFYVCQQCRDYIFFNTPISKIIEIWSEKK